MVNLDDIKKRFMKDMARLLPDVDVQIITFDYETVLQVKLILGDINRTVTLAWNDYSAFKYYSIEDNYDEAIADVVSEFSNGK